MADIDFFFDLSSPWTYLAFHNVQRVAQEAGATIRWRPFLVGGVFNAVNKDVYAARSVPDNPKLIRSFEWLKDWARLAGLPLHFPSPHHPLKSVKAMRFCCALEEDQAALRTFATEAFTAYFRDQRNLDDPAELVAVADACGMEGTALLAMSESDTVKARLRTNTEEAIARGSFGSPSIFVGDTMFFGNDQLPLVAQALAERATTRHTPPQTDPA